MNAISSHVCTSLVRIRCPWLLRRAWSSLTLILILAGTPAQASEATEWPVVSREMRPWTYWWWMGSAVDETNLVRELTRYRDAGLGGVHIIPIYGAKGWEDRYVDYLSPRWMELLSFTVTKAQELGLGVDMTTGTGWCFGGPEVTDDQANASVVCNIIEVPAGGRIDQRLDPQSTQALMAFGPQGTRRNLKGKLRKSGVVDWCPKDGPWRVYAISQKPSGRMVKRAAPGGEGHMLNLFYKPAMSNYLRWFEEAFASYTGPKPRAQYHDSYEYRSEWAPDFFAQFEKRRGYRLQEELPALFDEDGSDRTARVKSDCRETASDIMAEVTLPMWVEWSHRNGFLTRNEAHGSPGNWLDLYAIADMPETEMFYRDRSKLVSKFASSAAHVVGRPRVSCETGTWLNEHFTETLADMKYLLDDLFLSGVNHIFYHGTCYSPDEAGWPGWLFYASYQMNPRNSVWRDTPALNAYAARCQSVLQAGQSDNDVLLYWPIHDLWHDPEGLIVNLTVHGRDWFEGQSIGHTASNLWARGYAFDYISDRQLADARAVDGGVRVDGGTYRVVVIPPCERMPVRTFKKLVALARAGATIIFEDHLPADVPGLGNLESRRTALKRELDRLHFTDADDGVKAALVRRGRVLSGALEPALEQAGVPRESLFDHPGLMCIRRVFGGGHYYFMANRGDQPVRGWISLARPAESVVIMNPLDGSTGVADSRQGPFSQVETFLRLGPGESLILRCFTDRTVQGPDWVWPEAMGEPTEITGEWRLDFVTGGPSSPPAIETDRLTSWTELGGEEAQAFAGTVRYSITFDAPDPSSPQWLLDLGRVCQSTRVRLNGRALGTLFTAPFQIVVRDLKPIGNSLELEVTNVSANRIRDLDRRGVNWKRFHDINFVNLNYRPFDASEWPLTDSGLLGPVTLTVVQP